MNILMMDVDTLRSLGFTEAQIKEIIKLRNVVL